MTTPSYEIELSLPSHDYALCWQTAGRHLSTTADGAINWLKADLIPPFLEHLSFRLGNQLYYVRLVDVDDNVQMPGNLTGLTSIADGCNGHACLMPMKKVGDQWHILEPDWGLISADTQKPIKPLELISNEEIEMTQWELQDFAVQVVRSHITDRLDGEVMSSQSNPSVYPSIWFVGESGPEWVAVRMKTYPNQKPAFDCDLDRVAHSCSHIGNKGNVANVTFVNFEQGRAKNSEILPLFRGHPAEIKFDGLREV